jgi:predicted transcriptional regulator
LPESALLALSRRERQIMDFLFSHGRATAAEVQGGISKPPSYSTVRAILATLEEKGHVTHEQDGRAYVYKPTMARHDARRSALSHVLKTFFGGSREQALAALLDIERPKIGKAELERLARLVADAKREGR